MNLKSRVIHLAYAKPHLRPVLLPLLKEATEKEAAEHHPGDVWKTIFGGWRAMGRDGKARSFKNQAEAKQFVQDEKEEEEDVAEEAKHKKEEEESAEAEKKAPFGKMHKEHEAYIAKLPETIDKAKKWVKDIEDMSDDDYKAMREKDFRKELKEDVIRYEPWAPHGIVEREGLDGEKLDEAVKEKMTEIGKDLGADRKKQVQYAESNVKRYEKELSQAKEYASSEKGKKEKEKYEKAEKEQVEREKARGEREKAKGEREKRKMEREKRKTEKTASLRALTIRLAHEKPEFRPHLLPLLK